MKPIEISITKEKWREIENKFSAVERFSMTELLEVGLMNMYLDWPRCYFVATLQPEEKKNEET